MELYLKYPKPPLSLKMRKDNPIGRKKREKRFELALYKSECISGQYFLVKRCTSIKEKMQWEFNYISSLLGIYLDDYIVFSFVQLL